MIPFMLGGSVGTFKDSAHDREIREFFRKSGKKDPFEGYPLFKLGGSIGTFKDDPKHERAFQLLHQQKGLAGIRESRDVFVNWSVFEQLWPPGVGATSLKVIVLGAGTFGHALVKLGDGVVPEEEVHLSVRCYADAVADYLRNKAKIKKVVVVSPWDCATGRCTKNDIRTDKAFWGSFINKVGTLVEKGHVVIVHGDMARNGKKFAIMSGDALAPLLVDVFDFPALLFVSKSAVLDVSDTVVPKIEMRTDEYFGPCIARYNIVFRDVNDATGGMKAKCESAFNFVRKNNKSVVIMAPDGSKTVFTGG